MPINNTQVKIDRPHFVALICIYRFKYACLSGYMDYSYKMRAYFFDRAFIKNINKCMFSEISISAHKCRFYNTIFMSMRLINNQKLIINNY